MDKFRRRDPSATRSREGQEGEGTSMALSSALSSPGSSSQGAGGR